MVIEDIIFLGAGASKSEGASLQKDLFKDYFSSNQAKRNNNEMDQRLSRFFFTFFGIDTKEQEFDNVSFPTFEEALGMLEMALDRKENFKNFGLASEKNILEQMRKDLIFLIAIILNKKLQNAGKYHKKLINRLNEDNKLSKTVFVSLNYDILIDNALANFYRNYDLDYGVEFTNFEKSDDWKRPDPERAVYLFKLHGSLNWLYCPTCISLTLTPKIKSAAKLVFEPQNCSCGSEMIPIIIPPTFFKDMSNLYLQNIWHKAENALKQAKSFFFCGYSFPDADIHIKYLMKRIEINGGSNPEIFVINNYKEKTCDEKEIEELRYKRFFKKSHKVNYTNQSFENFCIQGCDAGGE